MCRVAELEIGGGSTYLFSDREANKAYQKYVICWEVNAVDRHKMETIRRWADAAWTSRAGLEYLVCFVAWIRSAPRHGYIGHTKIFA